MNLPYEFIDHTADYAMRARGADFPGLLRNALEGMVHLLADVEGLRAPSQVTVEVQGESREEVLVAALREVLYLQDDDLMAVSVSEVQASEGRASFTVGCVPLHEHRERLEAHVKAVTYHDLEIRSTPEGLVVEVVLDT